jgi:filamentous hemagglutinin family protein
MKPRKYSAVAQGTVVWALILTLARIAGGNPTHPVVAQGSATVTSQGPAMTVHTSGNAVIAWSTFNIGLGQTMTFAEPSSSSVVWNQINDPHASQILGRLYANGYVFLQNQAGFYVGGQAAITAAGVVMTTTPVIPVETTSSGTWQFNAPPPSAGIVNYGQINAGGSGPVFLVAHDVENHGTITAPGGEIGLYAGGKVLVSRRPDGRGLTAEVSLPEGSVDNSGKLIADAGTIALNAQVVNQGGMIQANSIRRENGVIELVAGDSLTLGASSVIQANGDTQGTSSAGDVTLRSGNTFSDAAGSVINVIGGAQGGAGGSVEISAPAMPAINSIIDARAEPGSRGGGLTIDPASIVISTTGGDSAGSGTVTAGSNPTAALALNLNTAFQGLSQIDLQASGSITLGANWDLGTSTGVSSPGSQLTLEAGNSIIFGTPTKGASITGETGWSVTLEAGRNFNVANTVVPGVPNTAAPGTVTASTAAGADDITLFGNSTVQTQNGSITLLAGNSISVSTGAVRTMAGGSIDAEALGGNINTGLNTAGYNFVIGGVAGNLGGISTAAGGNVNLFAGGNVTSAFPTGSGSTSDYGSGAFGPEPGVVTVTAGGNVTGHFVAADSVVNGAAVASTITAQTGSAGTPLNPLALSLAVGGWQVNAPAATGGIYLQEVRNPDGVYNGPFNYAPNSFVTLTAGDSIVLAGGQNNVPRGDNPVPVIYPPILTLQAGAGGVTLGDNLTLYPSAQGELNITTSGGGTLEGAGFELAMSDSGATSWSSQNNFNFATDHAAIPVQWNNPNPVVMNISGNVDDITISMPKETQITVKGEMDNTSFIGQNLHAGDVTSIDVAGRIFDQNEYAFVTLSGNGLTLPPPLFPGEKPDYLELLENAVIPGSSPSTAGGGALFGNLGLFYLPGTSQLGYYGQMSSTTEQLLTGTLQEKTYTADGKVILNANGTYATTPATFGAPASVIASLYTASQGSLNPNGASTPSSGFEIGGPGQFNLTAQSLDLGVSPGIVSEGPALNPALARLAATGAAIHINLTGDLDLFASLISSYYGGDIDIDAGGAINVGLGDLPFQRQEYPHGIWTSGGSDINIVAQGDINVDGSRIAAFNGGNVSVESLGGNVDAGTGTFTEVLVNEIIVNPLTHAVSEPQQPIAGSGILTTTFPNAPPGLAAGDITVLTPRGNIDASLGGIAQEPQNGNTSLLPTITLTAGTRDAGGQIVDAGNINATDSGVIGVNTTLNAAGDISGLVIARGNSSINAAANVSGTFLAGGASSFGAGGTISGIAIAGGSISVGGGKFEGVALSQNVSGGGATSALASTATASATSQAAGAQAESVQKAGTSDQTASTGDDEKKKTTKGPVLVNYTGRVTVILPKAQ